MEQRIHTVYHTADVCSGVVPGVGRGVDGTGPVKAPVKEALGKRCGELLSSAASDFLFECDSEAIPVLLLLLVGVRETLEPHMVLDVAILVSQGRVVLLALMALQVAIVNGCLLDAAVHDIVVSIAFLNDWSGLLIIQIAADVGCGGGVPRAGPGVPWYCFRYPCFR